MVNYVEYLNNYYDHIYVLSVEQADARRKKFNEHFKGLKYSFFYGADKNKINIDELIRDNKYNETLTKKNHLYSKSMMSGEIACAWSHRMIYEDIIKKKLSRALIFEDDAVPDKSFIKLIPEILNEIPENCELLMWGWAKNGMRNFKFQLNQFSYHLQHRFGKLKWNHIMIRNLYAKQFSTHLKKAGFHDYTYAYAINRSGAEKLIQMQTPIQYIADNLLAHASTKEIITSYITWPSIFLHDSLSDGRHRDSYIR